MTNNLAREASVTTTEWTDLSSTDLRQRLVWRGVDEERAAHLVAKRNDPETARFIRRVLARAWRDW